MNRTIRVVFIMFSIASGAQAENKNDSIGIEAVVTSREPNSREVQVVIQSQSDGGRIISTTNSYVQLETGLNYLNQQGEWVESEAQFEIVPGGAAAWKGQHKVSLAANVNSAEAVAMRLPDGKIMSSQIFGLAYYDSKTGESALIAELKDSTGILIEPNQILYPDAFHGLIADVRYTYTKWGFEQDIILREMPPGPERFGLDASSTRLEVWTEFTGTPKPLSKGNQILDEKYMADEELDFGTIKIGNGRTFRLGKEAETLSLVVKNWIVNRDGRSFLVEAVDIKSLIDDKVVPEHNGGASIDPSRGTRFEVIESRALKKAKSDTKGLQVKILKAPEDSIIVANMQKPGLVIDYIALNTSQNNYTFASDETYFITGPVVLVGATQIEGGTVVKFDTNTLAKIEIQGTATFSGSPYRPITMTGKDDNSIGQIISGSTGDAANSYYGAQTGALVINNGLGTDITHIRINHLRRAIDFVGGTGHLVKHAQIVHCQEGIDPVNAINLKNVLFNNVGRILAGTPAIVAGEHLTINVSDSLNFNSAASLTLANSLIVEVGTIGMYSSPSSTVEVLNSGAGVFAECVGGRHYLAANSPFRDSGTSNIDSNLANELKSMTTEAPTILSGIQAFGSTLYPRVSRDSDKLDKGYHYMPLDYILRGLSTGYTLMLTNGVAVGIAGSFGVELQNGGQFVSEGRLENLNRMTKWQNAQESSATEGNGGPFVKITSTYGSRPTVSIRFTELSAPAKTTGILLDNGSTQPFSALMIEHCNIRNIGLSLWPYDTSSETITMRNNLFERCNININHTYYSLNTPLAANFYNNLFWRGSLQITYDSGTANPTWTIKDNLFDGVAQVLNGTGTGLVSRSNNGFSIGTVNVFNGVGDKINLATDYLSNGSWGYRYYPSIGGAPSLSTLIDAGSRSREAAGLYHFTVKTSNSTKEGSDSSGTVDIGYHYVGLSSAGLPNDQDGDGIPDYVEDRNGNNSLDPGETSVSISNGVGSGSAALVVFTPLQ